MTGQRPRRQTNVCVFNIRMHVEANVSLTSMLRKKYLCIISSYHAPNKFINLLRRHHITLKISYLPIALNVNNYTHL